MVPDYYDQLLQAKLRQEEMLREAEQLRRAANNTNRPTKCHYNAR